MNPYVVRALGAVAAALGIVAIWIEFAPGGTTYWDGDGHAVGIAMLVFAILALAGVVLASVTQMRAFDQLWLVPGLALGGMALFIPLSALGSGNIDELKVGGWLGVAACGLVMIAGILNAALALAPLPGAARPAPYATTVAPPTAAAAAPAAPPEPEPAPSTAAGRPAGWYPDPTGESRLRYWDGEEWTENTAA